MPTDNSPNTHLERERAVTAHFRRLLDDPRLQIATRRGNRGLEGTQPVFGDALPAVRKALVDAGRPDRTLEAQMPKGVTADVAVKGRKWLFFSEAIGSLHLRVISPIAALARGEAAAANDWSSTAADTDRPTSVPEVQRVLSEFGGDLPRTVIIASTSGFSAEARELAQRSVGPGAVILLEPNSAGGWRVSGPSRLGDALALWDPEADAAKRERVRDFVRANDMNLGDSGLAADKIAQATMLDAQLVETELKSLARETSGLAARKLDGRLVLFRTGPTVSVTPPEGPDMIDRIKALFGQSQDNEKKVAYLSERRAALGQQRDRLYEELASLEGKESQLKDEFKNASGALGKRRITSQMLQLRKDAERRQQLLTVLNQQISVVGVHLHNLELTRTAGTGGVQGLPTPDEIAEDAAKAEAVLAELQASSELAEGVGSGLASGLSEEEAALLAELEAENAPPVAQTTRGDASNSPIRSPASPVRTEPARTAVPPIPRRNTPEAG